MEHNWPEVVASTLGSLAVRIVPVHMVTVGHMDLVGREGREKHCEGHRLPGGKSPDYHSAEGCACFSTLAFEDPRSGLLCCESKVL